MRRQPKGHLVIVTGVVLILLAMVFNNTILYTIGLILAVAGAVLWILGAMGRASGPRPHYWKKHAARCLDRPIRG